MEEVLVIVSEEAPPFARLTIFECGCEYRLALPQGCGKATSSNSLCARHKSLRWFWTRDAQGQVQRIPKGTYR